MRFRNDIAPKEKGRLGGALFFVLMRCDYGSEQFEKPVVADSSSVPLPAGLRPLTYDSTPGVPVAAMPLMPKSFVVVTVPFLRKPMP